MQRWRTTRPDRRLHNKYKSATARLPRGNCCTFPESICRSIIETPCLIMLSTMMHAPVALQSAVPAMRPTLSASSLVMSVPDLAEKKRGFPPGESAPAGAANDRPTVVGRVAALDFLDLSADDSKSFLGFNFAYYREAEIKHGRLAMLAAVAWPLQEIFEPFLANQLGLKDILDASNGASPSTLNGGLLQLEVLPAVLFFFWGASQLERADLDTRKETDLGWNEYANGFGAFGRTPGDFRFDPLNFYKPLDFNGKLSVQERELTNGRVAMLAVASYVATEFVTKTPVVYATSAFFQPIIFQPWFRTFMDASFANAASMPPPGAM